jgi:hypothetical protein
MLGGRIADVGRLSCVIECLVDSPELQKDGAVDEIKRSLASGIVG